MTRAFVIGNGKSLKAQDLDLLKGEITFAMNGIRDIYPFTDWRPTHWLKVDVVNQTTQQWISEIAWHADRGEHVFCSSDYASYIEKARQPWDYWKPNVTYVPICTDHQIMTADDPGIPKAWHLPKLCKFGTGAGVAFQLAALAGFSPIYTIGMDLDFKPMDPGDKDPNHFDEGYIEWDHRVSTQALADQQTRTHRLAHRLAAEGAAALGVTIINAGRRPEALADIYPTVTLEEALNGR